MRSVDAARRQPPLTRRKNDALRFGADFAPRSRIIDRSGASQPRGFLRRGQALCVESSVAMMFILLSVGECPRAMKTVRRALSTEKPRADWGMAGFDRPAGPTVWRGRRHSRIRLDGVRFASRSERTPPSPRVIAPRASLGPNP